MEEQLIDTCFLFRKNCIRSLGEILWLKPLRKLSNLMLSENPCSDNNSLYRHTGSDYNISYC